MTLYKLTTKNMTTHDNTQWAAWSAAKAGSVEGDEIDFISLAKKAMEIK